MSFQVEQPRELTSTFQNTGEILDRFLQDEKQDLLASHLAYNVDEYLGRKLSKDELLEEVLGLM